MLSAGLLTVCFVTARADPGGGPQHLYQLLKRLPEGFQALVACPDEAPYAGRYRDLVGPDAMFVLPHRAFRPGHLRGLVRLVRERGVDVLHSHGRGGGVYARLASLLIGRPCMHTFHGFFPPAKGPGRLAYLGFERLAASMTARLISVSEGEAQLAMACGVGRSGQLVTIANGVDIPPEPARSRPGPPWRVLLVGRITDVKNPLFWPLVLKELSARGRAGEFEFVVAGEGELRHQLVSEAERLGVVDRLTFLGFVSDLSPVYADAFCLMSASRHEGMPLALLEAMAFGLPVVASRVTGHTDVVAPEATGLMFAEHDAVTCANALIRLADEPGLHARLGDQARRRAMARHGADLMAQKTFALLAQVAAEGKGTSCAFR